MNIELVKFFKQLPIDLWRIVNYQGFMIEKSNFDKVIQDIAETKNDCPSNTRNYNLAPSDIKLLKVCDKMYKEFFEYSKDFYFDGKSRLVDIEPIRVYQIMYEGLNKCGLWSKYIYYTYDTYKIVEKQYYEDTNDEILDTICEYVGFDDNYDWELAKKLTKEYIENTLNITFKEIEFDIDRYWYDFYTYDIKCLHNTKLTEHIEYVDDGKLIKTKKL